MSTALRLFGRLDILSNMPALPSLRAPCIHARLRRLVTKPYEISGLVAMGAKLRRLHLMEGVEPQSGIADFPTEGGNEVENLKYVGDKVYINKLQYFNHVSSEDWNFYIGGYQPSQKWLKDLKGRILGYEDIRHYQRIVRILKETIETMCNLDAQCEVGSIRRAPC